MEIKPPVVPKHQGEMALAFVLGAFMAFCLSILIAVKYAN